MTVTEKNNNSHERLARDSSRDAAGRCLRNSAAVLRYKARTFINFQEHRR